MTAPTTDPRALFDAARSGDRVALARLLSLVERGGDPSRQVARLAYRERVSAYSIGLTGAPGAGKSTLCDQLITVARERGIDGGHDVGVLAVDPSSPLTGGAILGDRVRMQSHALDDGVFIRSMATRGNLGGLTVAVPDAMRVLAAAGLPLVLVETVGVGQVEVDVAGATDTTVVVVNPGWGDAIQANKAGLLEIADLLVVNKADRPGVRETRRDLELMLDLTAPGDWRPPIVETVASTGGGVDELWEAIGRHRSHVIERGLLDVRRRERLEREFRQILVARVAQRIDAVSGTDQFIAITDALAAGELDPYEAADRVLSDVVPDDGGSGDLGPREQPPT